MEGFRPTNDNYISPTASTLPAEQKKVGEIFVTRNFMELYVCSSCVAEVGAPEEPDSRFSTNEIHAFWKHVQFCPFKGLDIVVEKDKAEEQGSECFDMLEATNEKTQTESSNRVVLNCMLNTPPRHHNSPYNSNVNKDVWIGGNSLSRDSIIVSDDRSFKGDFKKEACDFEFIVLEEKSSNASDYSSVKKNSAIAEEDHNVGKNLGDLQNEEMVQLNEFLEDYEDNCSTIINGCLEESVAPKTDDLLCATKQHALETSLDSTNTVIVISDDEQKPDSPISASRFTPLVSQMNSVSEQTRNNSHNSMFPHHENESNLKFPPIQISSCASLTDPGSNQHIPSSDQRGEQCSFCAQRFDFRFQRMFHEKIHLCYPVQAKQQPISLSSRYGIWPFKCQECGRRTSSEEAMEKHLRRFHSDTESEHQANSKNKQKENGFQCLLCNVSYKQKRTYLKHIKQHHIYSTNSTNNSQTHLQLSSNQRISEPVVANSSNNPSAPTLPLLYVGLSGQGYHLPYIYPTTENDAITQIQRISGPIVANSTNNPSAPALPSLHMSPSVQSDYRPHINSFHHSNSITHVPHYRSVANSSNEYPYYRLNNSPLIRPPSDRTMTSTHYSWHKQSPY